MELNIQALHFDISEQLTAFVTKKADKLVRRYPSISSIDVTLKVVKPETAMNKQVLVEVKVPNDAPLVADKTADTFEEAVDNCLVALERPLERLKDR